jgi:hypothetical protein
MDRRERRRDAQDRRSLPSAPSALRQLSDRDPERAARSIAQALRSTPLPQSGRAELEELAADVASRLRRSGAAALALELAASGGRSSLRLRVEEALAAFAAGDDGVARQIAASDVGVEAVVGPLLDAVQGVARDASAPSDAPRIPAALRAASIAVAHGVRGEARRARAALRGIPEADRPRCRVEELGLTLDLAALSADAPPARWRALLRRVARSAASSSPDLRRSAAAELVRAAPARADEVLRHLCLGPEEEAPLRRAANARGLRSGGAGSTRAALELAGALGADAFEPADHAAARIFEGFALLRVDARRADSAFDRALALGGDMVEALRGKLLVARVEALEDTGVSRRAQKASARREALAADRLAKILGRDPDGSALAAAASVLAARAWTYADDRGAALAALRSARTGAKGPLWELDLLEARNLASRDPSRAGALVDAVLAADPRCQDAWHAKVALALAARDDARADEIVLQAADATGAPELVGKARMIRATRGELRPFDGLAPGRVTAGQLAAELLRVSQDRGVAEPLSPSALACREALEPARRLAFDAAAVAIATRIRGQAAGADRLGELLQRWCREPAAVEELASFACFLGLGAELVPAARALTSVLAPAESLLALCEVALEYGGQRVADRVVAIVAARLGLAQTRRLKALQRRFSGGSFGDLAGPPPPLQMARLLVPAFDLLELVVTGGKDDELSALDLLLGGNVELSQAFGQLADLMGDLGPEILLGGGRAPRRRRRRRR